MSKTHHASQPIETHSVLWQHPYVNVFKLTEQDIRFAIKKQGDVQKVVDKIVAKPVYKIWGPISANNYITFPVFPSKKVSQVPPIGLGLTGYLAYVQLRIYTNRFFVFHIDVFSKDDVLVKFSFSNLYKEPVKVVLKK